jgi:hypothetical protein
VVSGSVGARVARAQQPGQPLPTGDPGAIQQRQQRVMTERLLPRRRRLLLAVGMVDGDGGIDIDVQPLPSCRGRPSSPRRRPGMGAGSADRGQMLRVDLVIDQAPHRGRRRRRTEHVLGVPATLTDAVDAVRPGGDRSSQIGEHRTWGVGPRPPVGIGRRGADLRG